MRALPLAADAPSTSYSRRAPATAPGAPSRRADWANARAARARRSPAAAAAASDAPRLEFTSGAPAAEAPARGAGAPAAGAPADAGRVGVLLLNLGGPESLDDVQPFLFNLFADPDIIRLPPAAQFLQPAVAALISTLRAPKSREGYAAIGGGSPLRRITEEQGAALAAALRARGVPAATYVGMRYWRPFTEDAVEALKADGIGRLVVLPLYPQFSVSTSGSSLRLLERLLREDPGLAGVKHVVIPSWYARPGYVRAMADLIEAELALFGTAGGAPPAAHAHAEGGAHSGGGKHASSASSPPAAARVDPATVEIFFSAHGVPQSYVDSGDPYKEEMEHCVRLVVAELARRGLHNAHTLAYQSRVGPVEWLRPYTDDAIRYLAQRGVRALLAVPVSFVSEHIETLEEIDMEYRELAESCGVTAWRRVPALGTNAVFIDDLAAAVAEALPYVGAVAGAGAPGGEALVPLGGVESLLDTYDRERGALPPPVLVWRWGWTRSAEAWNGRIAMLAIVIILLLEVTTGRGVLSSLLAL
jgi:ferrochelatase